LGFTNHREIAGLGDRQASAEAAAALMKIVVDSGAYLAWRRHQVIQVDRYCAFLHANPHIDLYVNVDVIGEPPISAVESFHNFQYMQRCGLTPLAVLHIREPWGYLERYLDVGCPTIGLAGTGPFVSQDERDSYYHYAFTIIERSGARPKVHAFGENMLEPLLKFPFDSSDGSTWILRSARFTGMSLQERANDNVVKLADRYYQQADKYHQLELEVRKVRPGFCFYFGFNPSERWQLAAMKVVGHEHGLASWFGMGPTASEILKQLIVNPDAVANYYAKERVMLEEVSQRSLQ
jgi:hypothetical protein